jgi:cell division protein FtsL
MNKVLDFLKGVPKFIYILLFVIIAFVIILQMKNDEEAQKVQKTEIDNANTKIADEARIKSKEIVPMANQPVS